MPNYKNMDDYISQINPEFLEEFLKVREIICNNLPKGFEEVISYNMPTISVPHSKYPDGYHCKPSEPLPFGGYAAQKSGIHIYHMGVYAHQPLMNWFINEYPKHSKRKLDMGKSCIRFKKINEIPYGLIGELFSKMTVDEWIQIYEKNLKK